MKKFIANKKGFTLMEVLVSMAIFVTFTSILINSYSSIVKAQREANDYREMYGEAREVFDTLAQEFRDGTIDYGQLREGEFLLNGQQAVTLIGKDGATKTNISYQDQQVTIEKGRVVNIEDEFLVDPKVKTLNSEEVRIKNFQIYASPAVDPYDVKYVTCDVVQFQPKVTIYAEFEREIRENLIYTFELQTTVSSRIYNQIYPANPDVNRDLC